MEIRTREQYISYIRRTSTIPQGLDGSTPIKLIEEMVNKLPVDWSNPNLKILDPGFGFGGYLFFVYLKLIQFHSEKHILNNMLYGVEIEDFRFELVKHKLKIKNLIKGDFLDNKIFKDMKFDVILGNPPYSSTSKEPVRLWALFIEKGLDILTSEGRISFVTPSSWMSSTNSVYDLLKDKIEYVNVSDYVSKSFGSTGGSQKFVYFTANKKYSDKCITKFDGDIELEFNPTNTLISPIKSSSYFIFDLVEKLSKSDLPTYDWVRYDKLEKSSGVVVPMAKAASYEVQFHKVDDFEIGRYKVNVDEALGKIISKNLNTKTYQILRWVLRSGPALAGNFKLLPIPNILMNDDELLDYLGMNDDAKNFIKSYVV